MELFTGRKGKAKGMLSEYRHARELLQRALNQKPGNQDIINELLEIDKKEQEYTTREKLFYSRMFMTSEQRGASSRLTSEVARESEVTNEFQALIEERLQEFCRDNAVVEIPFSFTLSEPEFQCLSNCVKKYGLKIKEVTVRNKKEIRIVKSTNEEM